MNQLDQFVTTRLSEISGAVAADVAAIDGGAVGCLYGCGQRGEDGFLESAPRSAVVDRGARAIELMRWMPPTDRHLV